MDTHACRQLLGRAIREERGRQQLTQHRLADMVGTSQSHLWKVEHGMVGVGIDLLCRIADALGISLADLFVAVDLEAKATGDPSCKPAATLQ